MMPDIPLVVRLIRERIAQWIVMRIAPWMMWSSTMSLELDNLQQRIDELEGR